MVGKQQPAVSQNQNSVRIIHQSTVLHLDIIEKILLDELIRQGRAKVVPDEPGVSS
jgi:hypothetical protein